MSLAADQPLAEVDGRPSADDCSAVAALHQEFFPQLVRLCTRHLHDRALAEDIAQETMVRALRFWGSYDPSRPLWPWLKVIALHLCVDARRKCGRELSVAIVPDEAICADQTEAILDDLALRRAMADLPERQRLAVSLHYLDDRDRTDSAGALGINLNAFDQLIFRARAKLAMDLGPTRLGVTVAALIAPLQRLRGRMRRAIGGLPGTSMASLAALPLVIAPFAIAVGTGVLGSTLSTSAPLAMSKEAAVSHETPSQRAHATPAQSRPKANGAVTAPGGVRTEASAGPAHAHARLSNNPLAPGRAEDDRVSVTTPLATISAGGATENSPGSGLLCRHVSLGCKR